MPQTNWNPQTTAKTAFSGEPINKTMWGPEDDDPSPGAILLQNGYFLLLQSGGRMIQIQ